MDLDIRILPFEMRYYNSACKIWEKIFDYRDDSSYDRERFQLFLERNPEISFIAKLNDSIIGTVVAGHDGRRAYIYHIMVAEKFRKMGIARLLLEHTEQAVMKARIEKINIYLPQNNNAAISFYTHNGYHIREDTDMYSKVLIFENQ